MKALVVDSSSTMRSVLRRILSMRGFEVTEASDLLLAQDDLKDNGGVDLVLLELNVSEIDKLEIITRLRRDAGLSAAVLILAEAEPGARELYRALIAGADDYLVKPFTSTEIDEKLVQAGFSGESVYGSDRPGPPCRY